MQRIFGFSAFFIFMIAKDAILGILNKGHKKADFIFIKSAFLCPLSGIKTL